MASSGGFGAGGGGGKSTDDEPNRKNQKTSSHTPNYDQESEERRAPGGVSSPQKEQRDDKEEEAPSRRKHRRSEGEHGSAGPKQGASSEDDVGVNPFAALAIGAAGRRDPAVGGAEPNLSRPVKTNENKSDADSGIENFESEDVVMESPEKKPLDQMQKLRRLLCRVLFLSADSRGNGLVIPTVEELTKSINTDLAKNNDEIGNFLQNVLMEILFMLLSEEGGGNYNEASAGSRSDGGDSLSCSPSREPNFAVATRFLRQHSAVFNDLACVEGTKELRVFNYILGCYNRLRAEEASESLSEMEKNFLNQLWLQLLSHCTLLLRGYFIGEETDASNALLLRGLMTQSLPPNFVEDLVKYSDSEPEIFVAIFQPVLKGIVRAGNVCSLINDDYRQPLELLKELLDIKLPGTNRRPFCTLVSKRSDWIPAAVSKASGREISKLSFLGPFFSLSVFAADGWVSVADHYFPDGVGDENATFAYQNIRQLISMLRGDLHMIIHAMLVNGESRLSAVEFITAVLKRNEKRAQMQVEGALVAPDGFMLNFLSVMYELAGKVSIEKVNPLFPFHPNFQLDLSSYARLKMDSKEAEDFLKTLDTSFDAKFSTECFFLTMHAQRLALNPALNKHVQLLREIMHWKKQLRKLEGSKEQWDTPHADPISRQRNLRKMEQLRRHVERMTKSKYCGEAILLDELFLSRALHFASKQLSLLAQAILPRNSEELPEDATELFKAYPEFYLEDALDFILTIQKNQMQLLLESPPFELPFQILLFVCSTNYIKSPFLAAKAVEVLFLTCQPAARGLYETIMAQAVIKPFKPDTLFNSLMHFYVDVELTGSHTEFFDKFSFRYHVQMIMKSMWQNGIHRHIMMETGRAVTPTFVKFVSMVINDTTFLLDESLGALQIINEVETLMKDETKWNAMPLEEQRRNRGLLEQNQSSVKSWLQLTNETLDLFQYMTADLPQPFLTPLLGERLAAMLNYNMLQLCGPKCTTLKVADKARYGWEPRKLVQQLTEIYIHLDSPEFAAHIAADERSYSKDMFDGVVTRLGKSNIVGMTHVERMRDMGERAFLQWKQNIQRDEDWGEIPDEFSDPIMGSLMLDPVRLPTGHVMDRKVIQRHLLSAGPQNPFSRETLTEEELVDETELKKKIQRWIGERLKEKKPEAAVSGPPLD